MKTLEEKIIEEGKILDGNVLKVGSFLNQRLDVEFLMSMGDEVARLFAGEKIDKVLTVEASGIPFAVCVAHKLNGLIKIVETSGAKVAGCAIAIEKGFQHGGDNLRNAGYRVESLAIIDEMTPQGIKFRA